jgi:hypothetical protein
VLEEALHISEEALRISEARVSGQAAMLDTLQANLTYAESERDELKHDIDRHLTICTQQANEIAAKDARIAELEHIGAA